MSKQSESQGSEGSYSGTISPLNSTSREVSFAADLSCVVNDAEDVGNGAGRSACEVQRDSDVAKLSSDLLGCDVTAHTELRHRTLSWNTTHPAARKYADTYVVIFVFYGIIANL